MPEAVQLDATDVTPLDDEPCGGVHEELFASEDDVTLRVLRRRFQGELALPPTLGCRRVLLALEGRVGVDHAGGAPAAHLRPLAPHTADGALRTTLRTEGGATTLLELLVDDELVGVDVTALRLGRRTTRDPVPRGAAFVHAAGGPLVVRVTDEEEPFELEDGESLWLDELEGDEELEVGGGVDELVAVLVHLRRA